MTITLPDFSSLATPLDKADAIRQYIVANSVYGTSAWGNTNAVNIPAVLNALDQTQNNNGVKQSTLCGTRSLAMLAILRAHYIDAREVSIFANPAQSDIESHTFVEVWDGTHWSIQDPSFDLFYVDITGKRLGVLDVMRNLTTVLPKNNVGATGWTVLNVDNLRQSYFGCCSIGRNPTRFIAASNFNTYQNFQGMSISLRTYIMQNYPLFTLEQL